jgi:hypothetical protein
LPFGIPGIGDEIDGAMQQAPQPDRQTGWFISNGSIGNADTWSIPAHTNAERKKRYR